MQGVDIHDSHSQTERHEMTKQANTSQREITICTRCGILKNTPQADPAIPLPSCSNRLVRLPLGQHSWWTGLYSDWYRR